jgi:endonuclease I
MIAGSQLQSLTMSLARFVASLLRWSTVLAATAVGPAVFGDEEYGPPPGYYDRTFGLSGTALEVMLHEIIRGHTVQPYTDSSFGFDTWNALKVLDRDPDDATRVIEVYTGTSRPADDTSGSTNSVITDLSWEREHLWPRSYGVGNAGAAFSDLFNLRPVNKAVNQTRGNRFFDDPATAHPADPAAPAPGAPDCRYDAAGGQGGMWAPRPIEKAEIARAMFYMQVRYDGRDVDTVNLSLGDGPNSGLARFGRLSTMLNWHSQAEVTTAERRRNHLLFTEYQGNRNPFVDDPGFAWRIFNGTPPPRGVSVMMSRPVLALDDGPAAMSGVVALSETAASDTPVALQGDISFPGLQLPESVTVGAGQSTAYFTVNATAAAPPGFEAFRRDWSVTASAPGFGTHTTGVTLLGAGGRGWESFDRLLIYGNTYRDGSFTGQNGIRWNYFHATSQQSHPIDGRGILLSSSGDGSRIISDPIRGGIGRLAVDLRKAFTATGSRQIEVLINGDSRGFSPTFGATSGADATVLTYVLENLNVTGDFTLEIRSATGTPTSRRQLVVDDIRWTGWPDAALPAPELAAFPDRLSLPGYIGQWGPGEEVRFRVFGKHLGTGSLKANAPAGFEIALDDGPFVESLDLPVATAGMSAVFLRARMRDGLPAGDYAGQLVLSGGGAAPTVVAMSGTVDESADLVMPGLTASGYQQDFSGFAATEVLPFGWDVVASGTASNRHDISPWGGTPTGIKRGTAQDPVLGYQHTADTGNAVMRVQLENRTGKSVRALDVQYRGRVARETQGRTPQFTAGINGVARPALAFSTTETNGVLKRDRIGGLDIPPGGVIELSWTSGRGAGSGNSRQIGLSALNISLPKPPVLRLTGPAVLKLEQGSGFTDPGASALDDFDGELSITITGQVDAGSPGITVLSYDAVNSLGMAADPVTRTVEVLRPVDYFTQVTHGLQGEAAAPDANPSGDGIVNMLKFALGGNPAVPDPAVLPMLEFLPDGRPALRFRTGPTLAWDESASILTGAGLEISLSMSHDMLGWHPVATALVGAPHQNPLPGGTEIMLAPLQNPVGGMVFLRLRVQLSTP